MNNKKMKTKQNKTKRLIVRRIVFESNTTQEDTNFSWAILNFSVLILFSFEELFSLLWFACPCSRFRHVLSIPDNQRKTKQNNKSVMKESRLL
jgi:hypothetical protein